MPALFMLLLLVTIPSLAMGGETRLASLFAADAHPVTAVEQTAACAASRDHWLATHAPSTVSVTATPLCECRPTQALDLSRCEPGTTSCELRFVEGFACTFLGPVDTAALGATGED